MLLYYSIKKLATRVVTGARLFTPVHKMPKLLVDGEGIIGKKMEEKINSLGAGTLNAIYRI
jgi:hypothetical protein